MGIQADHTRELPAAGRPRNAASTVEEANRCLRDIIAISTLPAVWLGAKPLRIAESLLAALDTTVAPALGYIRFYPDASEPPIELAHFNRAPASAGLVAALGPQLTSWSASHDPDETMLFHPDRASPPLRVCVYPLGIHVSSGIIAAGFSEADGPTPFQRTLLNIAANQAMVARKNAALQRQQQLLYEKAQREIEERERTERALRESDQFNRSLIESSRDCIKLLDLEGRLLWLSEGGCRTFGVADAKEMVGRSWTDLWAGAEREAARAALQQAVNGGSGDFVGTLVARGEPRWWHIVLSPILGAHGKAERVLAVSRDISEHRRAEEALHASHAALSAHAEELGRFNRAAVDRELRMIELKQEVNELRAKLGLGRQYALEFDRAREEAYG